MSVIIQKGTKIIKIIPEENDREILFWQSIKLSEDEKKRFVAPHSIVLKTVGSKNAYQLVSGKYFFMTMEKKNQTCCDFLKTRKLSTSFEKKLITRICPLLSIIHKQGFVHADIHLGNILMDSEDLYLIDFGLVMHEKFCNGQIHDRLILDLYHWSREDFFTLYRQLLFYPQPHLLVKNNNYKRHRKQWKLFFCKHPDEWIQFKKILENCFEFQKRPDFKICFRYFITLLLSDSETLSPKPGVYLYDMLTKIYLERVFLLFAIYYPDKIKLSMSVARQEIYKKALTRFEV
jgi:serine/threonine protein kinase